MKTVRSAGLATALAAAFTLGTVAQDAGAAVVLNGCAGGVFDDACGLSELVDGGSLIIGDKRFDNWVLASAGGQPLNASLIRVDTLDDFLNPGFRLVDTGPTLIARDGGSSLNDLTFDVSVLFGPLRIKDISLDVGFGDMVEPGSSTYASVTKDVYTLGFSDFLGSASAVCDTLACAGGSLSDGAVFDRVEAVSVFATIDVATDAGGFAQIREITMRFSQTPEPGTLALLAMGALGIGFTARRRSRWV